MITNTVKSILEEPKKMSIGVGDIKIEYWSVLCYLETEFGFLYESSVTFDNLEDALNVKVGDVFLR